MEHQEENKNKVRKNMSKHIRHSFLSLTVEVKLTILSDVILNAGSYKTIQIDTLKNTLEKSKWDTEKYSSESQESNKTKEDQQYNGRLKLQQYQ